MNKITRDIFRAIHEGKWISIEYKNKSDETTHYWIAIKNINVHKRMLVVDGLNLANNEIRQLYLYLDSIQSTEIVDGTIFNVNKSLLRDIALYPKKYYSIFSNINNLKVLSY